MAERYARAARSDDLELKAIEVGDVDYLIASGLLQETLATMLIRVQLAYTSLRGGLSIACADPAKPDLPRYLIPALNGYASARQAMVRWALAERGRFKVGPDDAMEVAARVLDVLIDPNCPACTGRRYTGGAGLPTIRCAPCRETGKRLVMWTSLAEESFAAWLQASIEGKVDRALADMRRMLRHS